MTMSSWEGAHVEVNGIRLYYTRTGGAKPPLVLAHGVTDDGLCWTRLAGALAAEYDVIMVDARGHGRSDAPEQGYGPAEQAEDLRGLIAALGLQRPAILGHSMGAATTLVLAGAHPGVPGAILLEDPPAWWMPARAQTPAGEERRKGMRAWMAGLKSSTRDELIAQQRAQTPHWGDAEIGAWADSKLRVNPNVAGVFDSNSSAPVDWATLMPRISCPALLITADPALGAIVTEETGAALRELVPHLRIENIASAGHSIRRDQFDRYFDVVRGFLQETYTASKT
jgi:pimeloyl-ACP methyl ester carboxylesterase